MLVLPFLASEKSPKKKEPQLQHCGFHCIKRNRFYKIGTSQKKLYGFLYKSLKSRAINVAPSSYTGRTCRFIFSVSEEFSSNSENP